VTSRPGSVLKPKPKPRFLGNRTETSVLTGIQVGFEVALGTQSLSFIRRNFSCCPARMREQCYKTLVRPRLEYASSVWDNTVKRNTTKVEAVQRSAARFTECWTLRLQDVLHTRHFAYDMDTSPTGHFAYWTLRLLDSSPTGQFAYWTVRLLDTSPTGQFAYWTVRLLDNSPTGQFAYSVDSSPTHCEHKRIRMCDIHCLPKK